MKKLERRPKKMGRPPADWVYQMAEFNFGKDLVEIDVAEISRIFGAAPATIKMFLGKTSIERKHEVENGQVRSKFKTADLKRVAREYIHPWRET